MSKTQEAMSLVDQGMAPYAAAREVGLTPNTLYVALKRRREKESLATCPCCGSLVPGERIDREMLADGYSPGDERAAIAQYLQTIGEPNAASAVLRMNKGWLK